MRASFWSKVRWQRVVVASLLFWAEAMVLRQIEGVITATYYTNPKYSAIWSKAVGLFAKGQVPVEFLVTASVFTLITGVFLALAYLWLRPVLPEKKTDRVVTFAVMVQTANLVLSVLPDYLLLAVPLNLLMIWFVTGAMIVGVGAVIFSRVLE